MSFSIRLSADLINLDPGGNTPVSVEIANRLDEQDRYEMEIEGLDPEWTAVPVPMFTADGGEVHTEKLFFKPPRVSESIAGTYPFVVKVRSLNSGESRTTQGVLQIKPYHHLSMEVQPKKGMYSAFAKQNTFQITVMNLGNTDHTLKLIGTDPDDECAFEFEEEQVTVGPGQQKEVAVEVSPINARPFSSARLHGFSVTGRSVETPSVVTSAGAQLEQRPLMTPAGVAVLILALILAVGWIMLLPKPPSLDSLTLDRTEAYRGDTVVLSWRASHANSVEIKFNDQIIYEGQPIGHKEFEADEPGDFTARAIRESKTSQPRKVALQVNERPVPPAPRVLAFDIEPRTIDKGQSALIKYKLSDSVVKATLLPTGQQLDPKLDSFQITPTQEGTQTYTIAVENAAQTVVRSKQVKLTVVERSNAKIIVFRASPKEVDIAVAKTKLIWEVTGAVYVELSDGTSTNKVDPSGEKEVDIFKTTEYLLNAVDADGRAVKQKLRVIVKIPPDPAPTTSTTGSTTGTTAGTTGATTGSTTGGTTSGTTGTTTGTTGGTTGTTAGTTGTTGGRTTGNLRASRTVRTKVGV